MQITVTLTKETPLEVLRETATYIETVGAILHGGSLPAPQEVTVTGLRDSFHNVVTLPRTLPSIPEVIAEEPAPSAFAEALAPQVMAEAERRVAPPVNPNVEADPREIDVEGYPWDGRIHSTSRAKNANGTWRTRRNTREETVLQVQAELRNRMVQRARGEFPPPPLVVPALPAEPALSQAEQPQPALSQVAPPPPAATATVAPPPPPAPTGRSFDELMALITDVTVGDLLVEEDILQILAQFDVKELSDLSRATPGLVASVYNAIEEAAK